MNEQLFAYRIRQALDESAERLPFRVTQRLERSRASALARAHPVASAEPASFGIRNGSASLTMASLGRPSGLVRLLSTVVPILLVVAGLYGISVWDDAQDAAETADIDAELLLADDDIPLAAYADKGFGVYIKNVRQ
jgi:hypothetical protein